MVQAPRTVDGCVVHMLPLMQASEELRQLLQQSKHVLYGEDDHDPVPEHVAQLAQEFYQLQLIQHLLVVLPQSRKDIVQIFSALLQRKIGVRLPTVEYICTHPTIVLLAFHGCVREYGLCLATRTRRLP